MTPDQQITIEELIAAYLFDNAEENARPSEDYCAQAGRDILELVLNQFGMTKEHKEETDV